MGVDLTEEFKKTIEKKTFIALRNTPPIAAPIIPVNKAEPKPPDDPMEIPKIKPIPIPISEMMNCALILRLFLASTAISSATICCVQS